MLNYDYMLGLAQNRAYNSFTELQDCAFKNEDTYDFEKDLFVIGETSSGKTLIPLLLYDAALKKAEEMGEEYPKMLFVVPYRALAAQKVEEMRRFYKDYDLKIIQSTGEFRQDDDAIQKAQVNIAVVITEKIYKYEARDSSFLSQYDYLVIDEIGLISNAERGIRVDFILAWAENQKRLTARPRVVALGTPFYDWSAYIDSYGFSVIKAQDRPVKLDEINVMYGDNGIEKVEGPVSFLRRARMLTPKEFGAMEKKYEVPGTACDALQEGEICPYKKPCRLDSSLTCDVTHKPCHNSVVFLPDGKKKVFQDLLVKICREHLEKGHQVLIFVNDRARVMQFAAMLYRELKDLLPEAPPAEECREKILAECRLEGDDVFGIMENEAEADKSMELEFYQAFYSGVGFHSAALPNELRTYVENKLLSSRDMKIVCSTETLAYGVNSSVDAVIIADLMKHEGTEMRPLSLNEYQNYAGRAGRLRGGMSASDLKGYVYTLIKKNQVTRWNEMKGEGNGPEKLYSLFHDDQGQFMPFFLLNLLPSEGENSMSVSQLIKAVEFLPQNGTVTDVALEGKIKDSMQFLEEHGLAVKSRSQNLGRGRERMPREHRYCLTELGRRLRGYIIGCDDYLSLVAAIDEYAGSLFSEADRAKFLYSILCTKHAESGLNSIYEGKKLDLAKVKEYILEHYRGNTLSTRWIEDCNNEKNLFILASLLAWCDGESPKTLYRRFGIHYALLNKLAEQIAYLIEIVQEILPMHMQNMWYKNEDNFCKVGITSDDFRGAMDVKAKQIQDLFVSIYYGINTRVIRSIYDRLTRDDDPSVPEQLLQDLSLKYINPICARKLRRIVIRYKFFDNPPVVDMNNVEDRNNFNDQKRQYKRDVDSFGEHIRGFFAERFPEEFEN